jgi:hypothetical protein
MGKNLFEILLYKIIARARNKVSTALPSAVRCHVTGKQQFNLQLMLQILIFKSV